MLRIVLLVFALFLFLTVLRGLRIFLAAILRRPAQGGGARRGPTREEEMVRDPVCGTWVDRRLALSGRSGGEIVPVCSEKCLKLLETR
jgi:hypothetical protein